MPPNRGNQILNKAITTPSNKRYKHRYHTHTPTHPHTPHTHTNKTQTLPISAVSAETIPRSNNASLSLIPQQRRRRKGGYQVVTTTHTHTHKMNQRQENKCLILFEPYAAATNSNTPRGTQEGAHSPEDTDHRGYSTELRHYYYTPYSRSRRLGFTKGDFSAQKLTAVEEVAR